MANWAQLKGYIFDKYKVHTDNGDMLRLDFRFGDGRSQVVFVTYRTLLDGGEDWIHIESVVGRLDRVDLKRALAEVEMMMCGGLAQVGDFVTLRHSVPLANLDLNEFERPLHLVTGTADEMEKLFSPVDAH
jgi:hypothetical protein